MLGTGQLSAPDLSLVVSAALFGSGFDTFAARAAREWLVGGRPPGDLLDRLADRLDVASSKRADRIARAHERARDALARSVRLGYSIICLCEDQYPAWLRQIIDPPPALWLEGRVECLNDSSVAIVGSRSASPGSIALARTLARDLARVGLTVVSGLARGVDAAAHQGALDGGGRTIAVLGSGLDWVYPPEHRPLSRAISATGAVITELPPGAAPLPGHFPLRNRIISGLSRAVVVVEAAERSGALITASVALSQGREVLAVPGGVAGGRHKGCHGLIKDGARVVESVEDILEEISWPVASPPPAGQAANRNEISSLVRLIPKGVPVGLDRLVEATGRSAPELLAELSVLEIDGVVGRTTGPAWVRLD